MFAQVGLMKRLTGLLYFPITPTFPHFGLPGMLGYLPAKFKLRFLEPIRFDEDNMLRGQVAGADRRPGRARPDPGEPLGHAGPAASRSGRVGRGLAAHPRHRAFHLLGRPPGPALERFPEVEAVIGVADEEPQVELERPSS